MKFWRDFDLDQEDLETLREKIYEYTVNHPDEIDLSDVRNRIVPPIGKNYLNGDDNNNVDENNNTNRDWMLKRFLISGHKDIEQALEKFIEFFRYRKEIGVANLTLQNCLPTEFYQIKPLIYNGYDRENNRIVVIRLKYYKKLPQFELIIKRAFLYFFEKFDLEYEKRNCDGITMVIDCQEFGITNLDMDMLQFVVRTLPQFYSGLIRKCLIYELPYFLTYLVKVVESWMPSYTDSNGRKHKHFAVISKKDIDQYISKDQRPKNLNGTMPTPMQLPPNTVPFIEMARNITGLKEENIKKLNEYIVQLAEKAKD